MNRHQIETKVLAVLAAVLKVEVDLATSRQNAPQWDSLKHVEVIFAIEDELGLEFTEQEMGALDSTSKIIDSAMKHHAA